MKMVFEFHFMKKEGFVEKDFLGVISENLTQLGIVTSFKYQAIVEGYLFEIEYKEVLPGFTYQQLWDVLVVCGKSTHILVIYLYLWKK